MPIKTRASLMEVKPVILHMMNKETNINIILSDVLIKLVQENNSTITSLTNLELQC